MTTGPKAYVARHIHVVRDLPIEARTEWAEMLSSGTASPAQIGDLARARHIQPPSPHDGWVIIAGEVLGGGLYWMWGPRLANVHGDPFGPDYIGAVEALKPIRIAP